jgi:hypothetical protein
MADTKTDTKGVEMGSGMLVVVWICWLDLGLRAWQRSQNCSNEERFCCSTVWRGSDVPNLGSIPTLASKSK